MAISLSKANVMDVVTAVAETDVAVSTLVSVRDQMIQSYKDIMKECRSEDGGWRKS